MTVAQVGRIGGNKEIWNWKHSQYEWKGSNPLVMMMKPKRVLAKGHYPQEYSKARSLYMYDQAYHQSPRYKHTHSKLTWLKYYSGKKQMYKRRYKRKGATWKKQVFKRYLK